MKDKSQAIHRIKPELLIRSIVVYIFPVIFSSIYLLIIGYFLIQYFAYQQYNVIDLTIYKDKLTIKYPISLTLKSKTIRYSDIKNVTLSRYANKIIISTIDGEKIKIKNPGSTSKTELTSKLKDVGLTFLG